MIDKHLVVEKIFETIDELNEQLPNEGQLERSVDEELFGDGGKLDSLGLVNFIVGVEQRIEETFGIAPSLYESVSQEMIAFKTIGTLSEHIKSLLEERPQL